MKRIFSFIIILIALVACTTPSPKATVPAATEVPLASMPNPASVHCTQQGNSLEVVTASDGSQSGICVFPDGSACDEWAYYRGECGIVAQPSPTLMMTVDAITEEVTDWRGVIKSTEPGAQYDDYFERQDLGKIIYLGIDSMELAVKSQIEALRDSGKIVHLYGTLISNAPDYNGSQILVARIEIEQ